MQIIGKIERLMKGTFELCLLNELGYLMEIKMSVVRLQFARISEESRKSSLGSDS